MTVTASGAFVPRELSNIGDNELSVGPHADQLIRSRQSVSRSSSVEWVAKSKVVGKGSKRDGPCARPRSVGPFAPRPFLPSGLSARYFATNEINILRRWGFADTNMTVQMSEQTQKAKSRQSVKEWVALALFLATTALLVTLPASSLPWWLCFAGFGPFYTWAIVAMTEAEEIEPEVGGLSQPWRVAVGATTQKNYIYVNNIAFLLKKPLIIFLLLIFFALSASAIRYLRFGDGRANWQTADRSSAGLLPPASSNPDAIIRVFAARTVRWRSIFAVHTWIVVKEKDAATYSRYDYTAWGGPDTHERFCA